jgi:hypothetical protein
LVHVATVRDGARPLERAALADPNART